MEGASFPSDRDVRALVRAELDPGLFEKSPWRALAVLPMIAAVVALSAAVVALRPPWYVAAVASLVLGNLYARLTFFGHEVSHGSTVSSPWLKALIAYPCFAIFLLSPHLWVVWHNQVHHPRAGIEGEDPDNYGTMDEYRRNSRLFRVFVRYAPGGARALASIVYLCTCFTAQAQAVLWLKSRRMPGFGGLRRARAALDSAVMLAFWAALGAYLGPRCALFVIVLPMLVANFVVLSYISTNHMVSPLAAEPNTMVTTLGVSTPAAVDGLHLWFSHHVEHHLFPSMASHHYPKVREVLRRRFGEAYVTPPHWRALYVLLRTGRVYDGSDALIDPFTGLRAEMANVREALRGTAPLTTTVEDMGALLALPAEPSAPLE